ncbi:DUF7577 domain-containing protein [Natrinema salsiterrestre]|uniref:Zinc ribbon domain-containing protein n=1 Tax=Natrinema salsiterrestre TaxID=2950540 RepID=A0A9Q4L5S7_9EURY|nr:zinc ribbon domain-containing protein [Natrinema salsiterrestre]MDF9745796.1 zinc ribbon domain-containing protein [Natrinema salsiterrestre]
MVALEQFYTALIAVLLLIALGVTVPVLGRIVRDGLERRRKRQAGELERYTEDEEYDRAARTLRPDDDPAANGRVTCRECGTRNDPAFTYCRRCTTPL